MKHIAAIIISIFILAGLFWIFQKNDRLFAFFSKERQEEIISRDQNSAEEKIEAEENQKEKSISLEKIVFSTAQIQPIRKTGAGDLAVPNAHASLILDADSGVILHSYKGKERRQIASLTKLLTAVIVVEKISDLNEEVTIGEKAVFVEGTKIGCPRSGYCISERLKVGEKITANSLFKAMLMNSTNDAALALAEHISGSQEKFAELMNEKVKKLGLKDSHFCTPSGLEIDGREDECYSSAYDIARITAYSMKYDIIWETLRIPETEISSTDGKYVHKIMNTDRLLDQLPNCLGGKTGFTPLAGRSLITVVADSAGKRKIIMVVLDDPYRWQDVQTMASWAFQSYEWR